MSRTLRLSTDQYAALLKRRQPRTGENPAQRLNAETTQGISATPCPTNRPPRPSKYRSRATGGYASIKEARRAADLKLMVASGAIRDLREQVQYELIPKQAGERAVLYYADFVYEERHDDLWEEIVEDTKGYKKGQAYALFVLKRKLMLWRHGIRIRET